jgi:hypothetical protein
MLAKWTTLARFRAARDIAFDVSDVHQMCRSMFNAALRVWSITSTFSVIFSACTVQVTPWDTCELLIYMPFSLSG